MSFFKSYDIRAKYPDELNKQNIKKIAKAFIKFFSDTDNIVIGRDMRVSGNVFFDILSTEIIKAGKNVIDVGVVDTPAVYFTVGKYNYSAGIQITASHNPGQYNGFKLCRANAIPISYDTGLNKIEHFFNNNIFLEESEKKGEIIKKDILKDYINHICSFVKDIKNLKVVVDCGNGVGGKFIPLLAKKINIEVIPLYFELDGTFPNHEANPLDSKNMFDLQKKVIETNADIGAAFDGDADRVGFVDNQGKLISADLITVLIAKNFLTSKKNQKILYDLRSSSICKEKIIEFGGIPLMSRVGHSYIKQQLRNENAVFAGELSGHYYFKDNFYCDNGFIAFLKVLEVLSNSNTNISDLIQPYKKYFASGEINSKVKDTDEKLKEIKSLYLNNAKNIYELDGLSVETDNYWFNIRKSNTEPLLRLNLEANSKKILDEKTKEILTLIKQ